MSGSNTPITALDLLNLITGEKSLTTATSPMYLALSTATYTHDPGSTVSGAVVAPTSEVSVSGYSRLRIDNGNLWDAGTINNTNGQVTKTNTQPLKIGPFGADGPDIRSWFITTVPSGTAATASNIRAWGVLDSPKKVLASLQIVWLPSTFSIKVL